MKNAKGYLLPIGGAEDKGIAEKKQNPADHFIDFFRDGILRHMLDLLDPEKEAIIELITTASSIPVEIAGIYKEAFNCLGCGQVRHMHIAKREEVDTPDNLERIKACSGVVFTGGDQLRLSTVMGGTDLLKLIRRRYMNDLFVIAGTSAGAMAMSSFMIYEGSAQRGHLKGEVKITTGFGFIQNVIIDTHFEKRGRFNRLAQSVAAQPGVLGIGMAEDTGIIVCPGNLIKVIGSGIVTIINGKSIHRSNIADIAVGRPISIEHMTVSILCNGDTYMLGA
jgi:cyanophycinase